MEYASGHVPAAANAQMSVHSGRFGINTPKATIHGPSFETPRTGCSALRGTAVSIIETANAPNTSNAMPSDTIVDGPTTRYRCRANNPTAHSTIASDASRFASFIIAEYSPGCINR